MRHLISPLDFTVEETYEVLDFADRRKIWDGVLYKALSDYPNVSDNEMKDITMAFYRLR